MDLTLPEVKLTRQEREEKGLLMDLRIRQGKPQSNHILVVQNTGKRRIKGLVKHKHSKRPRNQDQKQIKKGAKKST